MVWNFTKLVTDTKTTYRGNSENCKQDKYQPNQQLQDKKKYNQLAISYVNCRKSKTKGKSWRKKNRKQIGYRGTRIKIALDFSSKPCKQEGNEVGYL